MNLSEFLGNWDLSTKVIVKTKEETIYQGPVLSIDNEAISKYLVVKNSVKFKTEEVLILVEYEENDK